ncbi:MAG TPA: hypothetical protein VJ508_11425 [Saprospiraceae bacterium]|nr:hypothetical protein [Saprospiraceae bacterium]
MNLPKAIAGLLVVLTGISPRPLNAQINLKTGYNISFLSQHGLNDLLHAWNSTAQYTDEFHNLTWLHGFEAGLRYKTSIHAFELTYLGGYQKLNASGISPTDQSTFKDKINIAINETGLGYSISGGVIGLGAEVHYQWYKSKATIHVRPETFKHVQGMIGYELFGTITLKGSQNIDLVLKPYYILPAESYKTEPLQDFLGIKNLISKERWNRFGISLLFYNGAK